jgi:hypothetical protein
VLRSLDFAPGTQIHIISRVNPPNYEFINGVLGFMADGLELYIPQRATVMSKYIEQLDTNLNHAFFISPFNTSVIPLLDEHFNLLPPQMSPYDDLHPDHQYVLYFAPAPGTQPVSTEVAKR